MLDADLADLYGATVSFEPSRLRQLLASDAELASKPAALDKRYGVQFKVGFDAIRELMTPTEPKQKRPTGFGPWDEQ